MSDMPPTMSQFASEIDCLRARDKWFEEKLASYKAREQMEPVGGTVHKTICTEQGENYRLAYVDVNIPADVALYAQPPLSPDVAELQEKIVDLSAAPNPNKEEV